MEFERPEGLNNLEAYFPKVYFQTAAILWQ